MENSASGLDVCQYCAGTGWGHPDNPAGRCFSCHGSGFARQPLTETAAQLLDDLARVNLAKRARIRELSRQISVLYLQQLKRERQWVETHRGFPPQTVFDSYREQREIKRREMGALAYEIASWHAEGELLFERPATAAECREAERGALEEKDAMGLLPKRETDG